MKKKIKLFIHPGFGNTGTSFLQEKVFTSTGFGILSKPREEIDKLIKLQYKVFIPKYSFDNIYPFNFTDSIQNYASVLKKNINDFDNKNFILSDECIFDRVNYFGYLNLYLLKEILDILSKDFEIKIKFIITIRRQWELIFTSWARSWRYRKSFGSLNNFIKHLNLNKDLREIYNYDLLIKQIKLIYNSDILILPLEELEINKKLYFEKLEAFLETKIKNENFSPINKNSFFDGENKKFYINKQDIRRILVEPLVKLHFFLLRRLDFYEKNFYKIRFLKKYLFPKTRRVGIMKTDNIKKQNIKNLYSQSNKNLEETANLSLELYDYY